MALMDLLPVLAAMAAGLVVWGVYSLVTAQSTLVRQRVAQFSPSRAAVAVGPQKSALLKDRSLSSIGALDRFLNGKGYADRVSLDLTRAAVPLRVGEYLLIRWVVAVVLLLGGFAASQSILIGIVFGAIGFYLPRIWLSRREKARTAKIEEQLVDALTMMANALKAGSSFVQAMEMVARELPAPIAQEFGQVVAEVGVGSPVDQALVELQRRVRSYDVYLMTAAMIIQRQVGGNLAEVLLSIAHTIRERQRLLRQVQVETAEMRLSAYVLIALPTGMFFLITVINRPYIMPLITEPMGRMIFFGALVMQGIGYLIMRKLSDIKV